MRKVIIESPYRSDPEFYTAFARECLRDCLERGEAPLASHLLYTQVLNDEEEVERRAGMVAGFAWTQVADAVVVYTNHGVTPGMYIGIAKAQEFGIPVEYRTLMI